ncbi:hypothetical protein NFI96_003685 [Prochilodus magdalenae]|nr:hypothetical protein NFI96_003685 [Prochilodus magdalenae]
MAEARVSVNQFGCPVCLELLKDPVTIPCGHSFCKECVNRCWDQENGTGVYSCPQCRRTFTPRPVLGKNTMLAEVVEKLKVSELHTASFAQERAEKQVGPQVFCYSKLQQGTVLLWQEQLVELQRKYQQEIREREKGLEELRSTVEAHKRSAHSAVQDTERIFTELICYFERKRSELSDLIRAQEEAAVRGAEGVLKRLEQEIAELRRRNTELEQLSLTEDHLHFLQSVPSLSAPPGSPVFPTVTARPGHCFEEVVKSVSQLRDKVEEVCGEEIRSASLHAASTIPLILPEPQSREDFLHHSRQLTLDPNTVNKHLRLSEGNRVATWSATPQPYPDHPDRFESCSQVLCRESVSGRCYWEVELGGRGGVYIAVSYKHISRKRYRTECVYGCNDQSWSLVCSPSRYSLWHSKRETVIPGVPTSCRVGVYVDYRAGTLAFYSVSDRMTLLHTVHTTFTHTIYPGFTLEHPHTVPAGGAVGVEVEGHQAFWTFDDTPSILVLTTVPPHTDSLGVSTKTKAGLVTEDDPLPF